MKMMFALTSTAERGTIIKKDCYRLATRLFLFQMPHMLAIIHTRRKNNKHDERANSAD
jgi:hypothetical protein